MKEQFNKKQILSFILYMLLVFIVLLLTVSCMWAKENYGSIGMDEIVFHLNMPLQGTSQSLLDSYKMNALLPTIVVFVLLTSVLCAIAKGLGPMLMRYKQTYLVGSLLLVVWIGGLLTEADQQFALKKYVLAQIQQSNYIGTHYVDPDKVSILFPEQKRNLITIYVESAETSLQDQSNGGLFAENYIPELSALAKEHVSFSHSTLLEGAAVGPASGWTIAGMVAETSGLPLKLYKYDVTVDNSMRYYDAFMPGATTLGDILEDAGYHNVFLAGSDFVFGGRTNYFTQHGNYEILDYYAAKEQKYIPSWYYVWWGFEDKYLFEIAKDQLTTLSASEQPFHLSMLTVDTHHEDGWVCDLCKAEYGDNQYANVWRCASRQISAFVAWVQEQDFYENTTIVIVGDHCSMDTDFYSDYESGKHTGGVERKVYNAFINAPVTPVAEENRLFTTMDFFPTTLAAIGVQIEGDRLGLGTNLFSSEKTLAEQDGYEVLFEELNKKSMFYNQEILYP